METNQNSELIKALIKAQSQFKSALKDASNPHLRSKYADLASIWDACKDALHANGLVVSQQTAGSESGWHLVTRVYHESGAYLESVTPILAPVNANAQQFGSGMTYARRYALAAILGIVTDDDDAEGAMNRNSQPSQQKQAQKQQLQQDIQGMSETQENILKDLLRNDVFTAAERAERIPKIYGLSFVNAEKLIAKLKAEIKAREEIIAQEQTA